MYLRMAGQNLLHQAGAGARHADNEHRAVGVNRGTRRGSHEIGAICLYQVAHQTHLASRIVMLLYSFVRALILAEGAVIVCGIFV